MLGERHGRSQSPGVSSHGSIYRTVAGRDRNLEPRTHHTHTIPLSYRWHAVRSGMLASLVHVGRRICASLSCGRSVDGKMRDGHWGGFLLEEAQHAQRQTTWIRYRQNGRQSSRSLSPKAAAFHRNWRWICSILRSGRQIDRNGGGRQLGRCIAARTYQRGKNWKTCRQNGRQTRRSWSPRTVLHRMILRVYGLEEACQCAG